MSIILKKQFKSFKSVFIKIIFLFTLIVFCTNLYSQKGPPFNEDLFPLRMINPEIIEMRELNDKMQMLQDSCSWKNRIGKKIDVFWLKTDQNNFFGHSYEYFMDCDNVRLIYWSLDPASIFPIVDFMVEDLEEESLYVVNKKKHLMNKKKYRYLLEEN